MKVSRICRIAFLIITGLSAIFFISCSPEGESRNATSGGNEVFVKADISLEPALLDLAQDYQYIASVTVRFDFASAAEILNTSADDSVDVYIFPNDHLTDPAREQNLADTTAAITLAYTVPCLIVSRINPVMVSNLTDLLDEQIRIGIVDPDTDILGLFSLEIFQNANLYDEISHRLIPIEASAIVLADKVSVNELDAAICWTMAYNWNPESFEIVLLMPSEIPRVAAVTAVRAAVPADSSSADRLMTYLKSDRCLAVFRDWGYLITESDIDMYAPAAKVGGKPEN
ncbi:hypothetical protein CEE37_02175 [candidate division LCP-89 bacterium B3_LCP]|uniref:Molybdate ABC transporter substrate-binding protein n=1 Tax=candidate division LCP-89 bacterium B3_LCP TaxID=2012998 RepID=A0A532V5N7_UNCL8|nr:MAG: hypothetical protein CEE37_02175 [candidate division LCP-89 bacterium B3_LCP]